MCQHVWWGGKELAGGLSGSHTPNGRSKTTDIFQCFLDRSNPVVEHFQEAVAKVISGRMDEG